MNIFVIYFLGKFQETNYCSKISAMILVWGHAAHANAATHTHAHTHTHTHTYKNNTHINIITITI